MEEDFVNNLAKKQTVMEEEVEEKQLEEIQPEKEEEKQNKEEEKEDDLFEIESGSDSDISDIYYEKMQTKQDYLDFFASAGYHTQKLPFNLGFLEQVMAGKKNLIPMTKLRHYPGPFPKDRELSSKRLWRICFNDSKIRGFFPNKFSRGKAPPKAYLVLVLYSIRK